MHFNTSDLDIVFCVAPERDNSGKIKFGVSTVCAVIHRYIKIVQADSEIGLWHLDMCIDGG